MKKTKILVIDDDELVCDLIASALQMEGYETLRASNGKEGVEVATANVPDLILCDVMMPVMDGFSTLRELRNERSTAMIPFIFLTGQTTKADMRQGMELGADDYLVKPVMVPELLAAIETRLQKHQLVRQETERKLNELRTSLSLSLPHEIRTPLSGIIGFAEVLRDDNASLKADEISEMASHIHKSATRLGDLVESFLIYAQLEILSASPDRKAFIGKESTQMLRSRIEDIAVKSAERYNRAGDLRLFVSEGEASISMQSAIRMIEELVDNAFKFSQPGSPVDVASSVEQNAYRLTVSDAGVGMKPENLGEIGAYRQFNRKSQEQQGTGLGLAITKRIAELYGGILSIESSPGKGTTVVVSLPLPGRA